MRFTYTLPADEDERFSPGCMDHMTGRRFPFWTGSEYVDSTLVSYEVQDFGTVLSLTVEVPDGTLPQSSIPSETSSSAAGTSNGV
jgi:hypothetical protein